MKYGSYKLIHADSFDWLATMPARSIHGVVTDPPYGIKEFDEDQLEKMATGSGGVWRQPPTLDGYKRAPVPRFTVLTVEDRDRLRAFFDRLAKELLRVLVPGAHVFIATNPLVSHLVYEPFIAVGFEKRGEVIRVVQTLRGGDRPKGAESEFDDVSVMPRSCWEPWGIFRNPCEGTVAENLRKWKAGGLRRISNTLPFKDLIQSGVARGREREIAPHPSLKPQAFVRQLTRAVLPLGRGVILDPFMGSGSTVAAAAAQGLDAIGVEKNDKFFALAERAVPLLRDLDIDSASGND